MMDIGVYCINALIDLFGAPKAVDGNCLKMHNGVDGAGTITANYGDCLLYTSENFWRL